MDGSAIVITSLVENSIVYCSPPAKVEQKTSEERFINYKKVEKDFRNVTKGKIIINNDNAISYVDKKYDGHYFGFGYKTVTINDVNSLTQLSFSAANINISGLKQSFDQTTKYFDVKKITNTATSFINNNSVVFKTNTSTVFIEVKQTLQPVRLRSVETQIQAFNSKYIIKPVDRFIVDKTNKAETSNGAMNILPITVNVEDYKAPSWNQTGTTGNIKGFKFVIQKNSFVELNMNFTDSKIVEAIGIPTGMFLEKNYIKGVPELAGKYAIGLKLDNGSILSGMLVVPNVPREK